MYLTLLWILILLSDEVTIFSPIIFSDLFTESFKQDWCSFLRDIFVVLASELPFIEQFCLALLNK